MPIVVVEKDSGSVVAALCDVMGVAGGYDTSNSRHGRIVDEKKREAIKIWGVSLFSLFSIFHIDFTHLKRVGNQLDSAANRLVVGIVVAALIIGSSIVMTVTGGPSLIVLSFFALFGFSCAVIGGLWLMVSIWKSNRVGREKPQ